MTQLATRHSTAIFITSEVWASSEEGENVWTFLDALFATLMSSRD